MKRTMLGGALSVLALAAVSAAPALAQKTRITVYTAIENEQLAPYKQAFEADNPDVEIQWVRDSTGVITARFLAEKDNPRADIIWGLSASSVVLFETMGLLEPYTPKGLDALKPAFRDTTAPISWAGMDAYLAVICYNNAEGGKAGAKTPAVWADLTKPEFKGKVVMPHPASSGTGYLAVAGWIQSMGEQKAWEFMDKLHDNIAVYTHSGSAPCVQAARGEQMVGLALDMRGASEKTKGAPIEVILPTEGVGWEMEANAIVKGTKNAEAAKKIADWSATKDASELYSKSYAIVAYPGVKNTPANYPANAEAGMIKNDLGWMADNRDRVLAEWSKRYESKAAPKN
ncbi:MAG: putative 2-aminoethylphosphonate ABC transporter substrate-binding protein [Beijerinckiaceae bacterium]